MIGVPLKKKRGGEGEGAFMHYVFFPLWNYLQVIPTKAKIVIWFKWHKTMQVKSRKPLDLVVWMQLLAYECLSSGI